MPRNGIRSPRVTLSCEFCRANFDVLLCRASRSRFCSVECRVAGLQVWAKCLQCGETFKPRVHSLYCSRECNALGRRKYPEKICEHCGKTFRTSTPKGGRGIPGLGKFCSRKCKGAAVRGVVPSHLRELFKTKRSTGIELKTYEALDRLGVTFERQASIGPFFVDAFLSDRSTVIECQGDYWHCNPDVYPNGPKGAGEEFARIARKVAQDKGRRQWLEAHGYCVIELWERDIHRIGAEELLRIALVL
jgi:G:T-mismatch repair DNA endonuclease (very short patch repair protein)